MPNRDGLEESLMVTRSRNATAGRTNEPMTQGQLYHTIRENMGSTHANYAELCNFLAEMISPMVIERQRDTSEEVHMVATQEIEAAFMRCREAESEDEADELLF